MVQDRQLKLLLFYIGKDHKRIISAIGNGNKKKQNGGKLMYLYE